MSDPFSESKIGIANMIFEILSQCLVFIEQASNSSTWTSVQSRWSSVGDFSDSTASHHTFFKRKVTFFLSKSQFSRYLGQGRAWMDHKLFLYVCVDRKQESLRAIQNSVCGRNGIMLQFQLVTTADEDKMRKSE